MNYTTKYYDIDQWQVIDRLVIHDFSDNPINVLNVQIGKVYYLNNSLNPTECKVSPITRWITEDRYQFFIKKQGAVLW